MKIKNMLAILVIEIVLLFVIIFAADAYSPPRVQCGFVQGTDHSAIVCTDGTIYIMRGGGIT